jgi:acetyl-CoA carboxylase carboxyl transferase subunit alpha
VDYFLEFEKPVSALENQIKELKKNSEDMDISREIDALQAKVDKLIQQIYSNLNPWQRVQLSRHPLRPHCRDYIAEMIEDFHELCGDQRFSDDQAIMGGVGYLKGQRVMVIGIEKGRKTKEKIIHNFGMPRPDGYRKALRLMKLAEQFSLPVITLIDTPGAYPGMDAEERGQAQAIAENIEKMFTIKSPMIALVIGEGGSGGALGLAVADEVLMMEYSVYSVISPESCASILWSDPSMAEKASNALKMTPDKAKELKVIDGIINEPFGGAHRSPADCIKAVELKLHKSLSKLKKKSLEDLLEDRFKKFRQMGQAAIEGRVDVSSYAQAESDQ